MPSRSPVPLRQSGGEDFHTNLRFSQVPDVLITIWR